MSAHPLAAWPELDDTQRAAARQARADGVPVVGLVGTVTPVELVLAARVFPLALSARAADWARHTDDMEDGHEPEVRSLFMQGLEGEFELCDLVVIPSASDGHRFLFQYLREMQRQGRADRLPPLHHLDLLFGPSPPVRRHSLRALHGLVDRLSMLTGHRPGDAELCDAIARCNALRRLLALLNERRAAGQVIGVDAHRATRTCGFAPTPVQVDALAAWVAALGKAEVDGTRPRLLLVSAVPLYHEALHAACEAAGALVTAEDDEWGARRGAPPLAAGASPLEAMFDHLVRHAVSPRMLRAGREAWVTAQLASGAYDGVVFYVPPSDQYFGWRYPALKAQAEQAGLATLLVRDDALDPASRLEATLAPFVAGLAVRRGSLR